MQMLPNYIQRHSQTEFITKVEDSKMNQDNGKFTRENRSVEHGDSNTWIGKGVTLCKLGRDEEAEWF